MEARGATPHVGTDTGALYGLGETTVEESDTYYVTDMHTGRVMRYSGPGAHYRARTRMVAGLYFRPDMPDIIFRGGRLATQNGKGGLVTEVAPLKDPPGGLGLSVESFELCCRCSRPGCNAQVFTPAARGVRRSSRRRLAVCPPLVAVAAAPDPLTVAGCAWCGLCAAVTDR